MSRRKSVHKKESPSDPIYNDVTVAKLINTIMLDGKKSVAERLVYGSFDELKSKVSQEEPLTVFKKALENVKPAVEVRSRRVGGATYQVPCDVRPARKLSLALRWLVTHARARGEKNMALRLAGEVADAYNGRGNAVKKKEDVHRMAEANKAFSHYNW